MTIDDIRELIRKDETRTLELKRSTGELKEGMHSICAFLNTAGGDLIFGITPSSLQINGQQVTDNTRKEIARELTKIEPAVAIEVQYIEIEDKPGNYIIKIEVPSSLTVNRPYVYDGKAYYRIESTTSVMPQSMYQELLRKKDRKMLLWEEDYTDRLQLEDLDKDSIGMIINAGIQSGRIPENIAHRTISEILDKMKLSDDGKIKNAALALFVKKEAAPIRLHLRMARFKGISKKEFVDNRRSSGNIFYLYEEGMAFLFKHLNISGKFINGQPERIESLTIPYLALRECLLNALAHRSYDTPYGFVSIAVFDDRIEIENSGALPVGFSLDDLMKPHISHAQNPLIAQIMYYGKYLETWGRGIELMNEECENAKVPAPKFEVEAGCFKVTFTRKDYIGAMFQNPKVQGEQRVNNRGEQQVNDRGEQQVNDIEQKIINILSANPRASISNIAEKISLSRKNTHKHMASMQEKGLIERIGANFGGSWKVK